MASDIEDILAAVRSLPPQEQQEVLRRLTESLVPDEKALDRANESFWKSRSIDEIIREQQINPIYDLRTLAFSDWPEDESVDAFDCLYLCPARRRPHGVDSCGIRRQASP